MPRRTPNPKRATVQRPELPLCGINATNGYFLGREYRVARNGRESSRVYVEWRGVRVYLPEDALGEMLERAYTQ